MSFDYGTFLKFGFPCYDSDFHQENDSQTTPGQALLLQKRLTEVNHPDHLIIIYPDLGHGFVPSNQWIDSHGQMEEYVFQDMFEWLTSPAREVNQEVR